MEMGKGTGGSGGGGGGGGSVRGTNRAGALDQSAPTPNGRKPGKDYDNAVGREDTHLREPDGVDARAGCTDAERMEDIVSRMVVGEAVPEAEMRAAAIAMGLAIDDVHNRIAAERAKRARDGAVRDRESIRDGEEKAEQLAGDADRRAAELEAEAARTRAEGRAAAAAAAAGLGTDAGALRQRERELMDADRDLRERCHAAKLRVQDVGRELRRIAEALDGEMRATRSELTLLRRRMNDAGVQSHEREDMQRRNEETDRQILEERARTAAAKSEDHVEVVPGLRVHDPARAERLRAIGAGS